MAAVLVDTSIWLEVERGLLDLDAFVAPREVAICPPIAQELLQGLADGPRFTAMRSMILDIRMIDDPMPFETFEEAAQIFRHCRAKGHTIASNFDCLIAAAAVRNRVPLLHRDVDFEMIAEVVPLVLLRNR